MTTWLCGDAEESANEERLAEHNSFAQPSHSPLRNHVDCFDALQGPPRALKRAVAFGQPHTFFFTKRWSCSTTHSSNGIGAAERAAAACLRLSAPGWLPDTRGSCPHSAPMDRI